MAEVEGSCIFDLDRTHLGERWAVAAAFNQLRHRGRRAGDHHLDGAVEPVADPTFETETQGLPLDPGAKTNFLDDAADHQPFDLARFNHHAKSLRSKARYSAPPPSPACQATQIVWRNAGTACRLCHDIHVAGPRPAARLVAPNIDQRGATPAVRHHRYRNGPIEPAIKIFIGIECRDIAW